MPRKYIRVLGPTARQNYSNEALEKDAKEVLTKGRSVRSAAEKFGVPKSTLADRVKIYREGGVAHPIGRPTVISEEEEIYLSEGLMVCAEWRYPYCAFDIKLVVASYLNRMGRVVHQFKNNEPGDEWVRSFLKRHPELTVRFAENIKRSRAAVGEEELNEYFNNAEEIVAGITPENLVNFDETNFTDDPGKKKVVARRGCRHPERVMDHSKTSVSVMMAASGSGELLPPYVVYKAKNLYPTWIEGGIAGSRYACTTSGWFDMHTFEDWFVNIAVPFFRNKEGKKGLFGDNLQSHVSMEVVRLCRELDIEFFLLPPHSTHICQPLDVTFFKPAKTAWRKCLDKWKAKNRRVVPKSSFPSLLREAIESMGERLDTNIRAGFKACGLVPFNREEVMKRIPRRLPTSDVSPPAWTEALVRRLEDVRRADTETRRPQRGKRLSVKPGTSLSAPPPQSDDDDLRTIMDEEDPPASPQTDEDTRSSGEPEDDPSALPPEREEIQEGDFILVRFLTEEDRRSRLFVGRVENDLGDNQLETRFLRKKGGKKEVFFAFPDIPDVEIIGSESKFVSWK